MKVDQTKEFFVLHRNPCLFRINSLENSSLNLKKKPEKKIRVQELHNVQNNDKKLVVFILREQEIDLVVLSRKTCKGNNH